MKRIEEARDILKELQVPVKQQSDMCCYVLLAMAQINKKQAWSEAHYIITEMQPLSRITEKRPTVQIIVTG